MMSLRASRRFEWAVALVVGGLVILPGLVHAADHRDGPKITDLNSTLFGALDLNDLYIFVSPANRNNTVLVQTMSPGAGIVGPGIFFPGAFYELRISNDGNPLTDEIVFQTTFGPSDSSGRQRFVIYRQDVNVGTTKTEVFASGITNRTPASIRGGARATAGIFDDPFFFDVNATSRANRELTLTALGLPTGAPAGASPIRFFLPPNFPQNFFGGANTLAIIIEIPRLQIQSSRNNPNITAWIRSLVDAGDGRGFNQFDRTAIPSINTVVVPLTRTINGETLPNGLQDQFNLLTPADDIALRPIAANRLRTVFGLPADTANRLANNFLPDVASFNTTDSSGFPNGRQFPNDVIDTELGLLTNNAVTSDRVVNDSFFRSSFPYIGTPNPVTQILRDQLRARMSQ
jgi:Domain of unknown function (DUF4331)